MKENERSFLADSSLGNKLEYYPNEEGLSMKS